MPETPPGRSEPQDQSRSKVALLEQARLTGSDVADALPAEPDAPEVALSRVEVHRNPPGLETQADVIAQVSLHAAEKAEAEARGAGEPAARVENRDAEAHSDIGTDMRVGHPKVGKTGELDVLDGDVECLARHGQRRRRDRLRGRAAVLDLEASVRVDPVADIDPEGRVVLERDRRGSRRLRGRECLPADTRTSE